MGTVDRCRALALAASFALAFFSIQAEAGGPPPAAPANCVDLRLDCNPYSSVAAQACGAGPHAGGDQVSYLTLGSNVESATIHACGGGTTTITSSQQICSLPGGFNDNVCGVDIVLKEASCGNVPALGCGGAEKSLLAIKKSDEDAKNKLKWKWINGAGFTTEEIGDPTTDTSFALCVFNGGVTRRIESLIPTSDTLWKAIGTKGFKFKDISAGVHKALIFSGEEGHSKALDIVKGLELPGASGEDEYLPVNAGVIVQLIDQTGRCYESEFLDADVRKNAAAVFVAKNSGVVIATTTTTTTLPTTTTTLEPTTTTLPPTTTTTLPPTTTTTLPPTTTTMPPTTTTTLPPTTTTTLPPTTTTTLPPTTTTTLPPTTTTLPPSCDGVWSGSYSGLFGGATPMGGTMNFTVGAGMVSGAAHETVATMADYTIVGTVEPDGTADALVVETGVTISGDLDCGADTGSGILGGNGTGSWFAARP